MVTKKTRAVKNKRQVIIMWILRFITPGGWKHQNKKSYGLLCLGCKSWYERQLPVIELYFVFLTWCALEASCKPVVWWWRSLQSLPDLSWATTLHGIQSNGRFNVSFMLIEKFGILEISRGHNTKILTQTISFALTSIFPLFQNCNLSLFAFYQHRERRWYTRR